MMVPDEYISSQVREFREKQLLETLERRRIIKERLAEQAEERRQQRMSLAAASRQAASERAEAHRAHSDHARVSKTQPRNEGILRRLLAGAGVRL